MWPGSWEKLGKGKKTLKWEETLRPHLMSNEVSEHRVKALCRQQLLQHQTSCRKNVKADVHVSVEDFDITYRADSQAKSILLSDSEVLNNLKL